MKVGNVLNFAAIDAAQDEARKKVVSIKTAGKNPNVSARKKSAAENTLEDCLTEYREELTKPPEPAKPNTFTAFDKTRKKLEVERTSKSKSSRKK